MPTISNLGNGTGRVYVTLDNGTTIVSSVANTGDNVVSLVAGGWGAGEVATQGGTNVRYFLNDDGSAPANSVTGALEITDFIVGRGLNSKAAEMDTVLVSGTGLSLEINRRANIQFLDLRGSSAPSANDTVIAFDSSDVQADGDLICLVAYSTDATTPDNTITLLNAASGGNLVLDGDMVFTGGNDYESMWLRYNEDEDKWVEVMRNPSTTSFTVQQARTNGLGVQGDDANVVTVTAGGSLVLDPNSDSKVVTLTTGSNPLGSNFTVSASSAKAGDTYIVRFAATYIRTGGDVVLFGQAVAGVLVPEASPNFVQAASNPVNILCYYDGTNWHFSVTVAITRYEIDLGNVIYKKYVKATYDFDAVGGAIGTFVLATNGIPANSLIALDEVVIITKTALTSAGSAQVAFGLASDNDALDGFRAFNNALYATPNATNKSITTLSSKSFFAASGTNITFTVSTAALTAGKVEIYVPYILTV
jgi:hypothetical protein